MWAYVDETGNTGQNIFDPNQPIYLTAALMTRTNFDLIESTSINRLARSVGVKTFHANQMGVQKINDVSPQIAKIFKRCGAKFFVSRLEKKYLVATKVIDTYFDQGENMAVPWHMYWIRPMRLTLTFKLASFVLTEEIAQCVWKCLTAKSERSSKEFFVEGAELMLSRVDCIPDARSRDVVEEALKWAIRNPENFDTYSEDKVSRYFHSPNFVAFTNLMDGIEQASQGWKRPVREIVHDEQFQFEKTFQRWHTLMSQPHLANATPLNLPGKSRPVPVSFAPGSKFRISNDEASVGLQMVDVLLWLFRRLFEGREIGYQSRILLNVVLRRAYQQDFSFDGVGEKADEAVSRIMEGEIPEGKMEVAKSMLADHEAMRRRKIEEYELKKIRILEEGL